MFVWNRTFPVPFLKQGGISALYARVHTYFTKATEKKIG